MHWFNIIILFLFYSNVNCGLSDPPTNLPCKLNDIKCTTALMQWVYTNTIIGVPEKGIAPADVFYHDKIEGNLGYVKYLLTKTYIEGCKFCKVNETRLNSDASIMSIDLSCRRFHMDGDYEIYGKILNFDIQGKGPYYIDTTNYRFLFDSEIKYWKKNGKIYATLGKFTFVAKLLGDLDIELRNLFGGRKELSDPIHQFAKKNAKVFTDLLHDPIVAANIQKIVDKFNSLFKAIPITDLIQLKTV